MSTSGETRSLFRPLRCGRSVGDPTGLHVRNTEAFPPPTVEVDRAAASLDPESLGCTHGPGRGGIHRRLRKKPPIFACKWYCHVDERWPARIGWSRLREVSQSPGPHRHRFPAEIIPLQEQVRSKPVNTDEKYDITERKQDLQHMVNLLADAFPTNELYLDARNTLSRLLGG